MKVCSLWEKDIVEYMEDFNYVVVEFMINIFDVRVKEDDEDVKEIEIDVVDLVLSYFVGFGNVGLSKCYKVVDDSKKIILMD